MIETARRDRPRPRGSSPAARAWTRRLRPRAPRVAAGLALWVAAALPFAAGCVVLVPAVDGGEHCTFDGDSACAACLRESCQAPIDACCGDADCRGEGGHSAILEALDTCGEGDTLMCRIGVDVGASGSGRSGADGAVRACVTTSCAAECLGDAQAKPTWSCAGQRAEQTDCAACLYDECASALDECCADASCEQSSSLAEDLGRCVGGDAPGCVYGVAKNSDVGFEGKVRACIVDKCAECLGDGRPHASCQLYGGGAYCACTNAAEAKGECTPSTAGGDCVLGEDGCTCGRYSCTPGGGASGSCLCDFQGGDGDAGTCDLDSIGGEGTCCVHRESRGFSCSCEADAGPCNDDFGDYGTVSCRHEDVLPVLAKVLVESCSN